MTGVHVHVRAGGEDYAFPVEGVREVANRGRITPVPGAPSELLGIWSLRGDVMAVVDLAAVFGLERNSDPGRVLVAEEGDIRAGFTVESVVEVGPLPQPIEPAGSDYLSGAVLIDRTPVGVIELGAILAAVTAGSMR